MSRRTFVKCSQQFEDSLATSTMHFRSGTLRIPCVGKSKEHLGGRQFSNDRVRTAALRWLQNQGAYFYRQSIEHIRSTFRQMSVVPTYVCFKKNEIKELASVGHIVYVLFYAFL